MSKNIALFGGSFDPPHLGHACLVETAVKYLNINDLWLIPVGLPVHRELSGKATIQQRMGWLNQIFEQDKHIKVIDWEAFNAEPTPTIATLKRFKKTFPDIIPTWLMGLDSFLDLPNWVGYPDHLQLCNIAVFQRKGHERSVISDTWKTVDLSDWQKKPPVTPGHMVLLDVDLPDISSTQIRQNVHQHQHHLSQSTCNAISVCYDSDLSHQQREDT